MPTTEDMAAFPLESFVFYRSFRDAIDEMNDADKLATLMAICDYALYGVEPELERPVPRAIFTVARPSIDANNTRRINGGKGGRPPKKKPTVSENKNHRFSKTESTETESVAETVSETGTNGADKPPTRSRFTPPTVEEVRAYCQERSNGIDPERFVDFYQSNGWMRGKTKIKDWKACVRTWEKNNQQTTAPLSKAGYIAPNDDPGNWMEG